jgi:hypothetical protein
VTYLALCRPTEQPHMSVSLVDQMCEHMCAGPSRKPTRRPDVIVAQWLDAREQSSVASDTRVDGVLRSHDASCPIRSDRTWAPQRALVSPDHPNGSAVRCVRRDGRSAVCGGSSSGDKGPLFRGLPVSKWSRGACFRGF